MDRFSLSLSSALMGLGAAFVVTYTPEARGAIGACTTTGDAPTAYLSASCGGVCVESGDEVVCELETLCPDTGNTGATAFAVRHGATPAHDVAIFGQCTNTQTRFCCVFDEGTTNVDTIELNGTNDPDSLYFNYENRTYNLEPWDADHVDGFLRGNEASDVLEGSDFGATSYDDHLYGQDGWDTLYGLKGGDFLSGGDGNDELWCGDGNDTAWGGDGDDSLYGGLDNDKLCDASGYDSCATNGGNKMDGGIGNDSLWYNESENPNVPCPNILLHSTSTGGQGDDDCGDANDYGLTELPQSCLNPITTVPVKCDGAN